MDLRLRLTMPIVAMDFPFEGTLDSVTITLIDTKKDPKNAESQARAEMGRQ